MHHSSPAINDLMPPVAPVGPQVPVSPAARTVARRFLETAVGRQDLARAYTLVGPWLKGVSRKQWIKGNNPVTYFPASNLKTAPFKVLSSAKNALMLGVGPLVAPKGTKLRRTLNSVQRGLESLIFRLEVDRIRGKWLVNYFMPNYTYTHLANTGDPRGN